MSILIEFLLPLNLNVSRKTVGRNVSIAMFFKEFDNSCAQQEEAAYFYYLYLMGTSFRPEVWRVVLLFIGCGITQADMFRF